MDQKTLPPPMRYGTVPPVYPGAPDFQALAPGGVSAMQGLGFGVLICFLFMIFSRVFDLYFVRLHLPGISERVMAVVAILSGSFWRPFQTKIGKRLLWFTAWMVLGLPFSIWKGDSFQILTHQWWVVVLVFVAAAGLIADFQQYRRVAKTLAVAFLVLSILCLHFGTLDSGRLHMDNNSRFANPNEMAQAMLIGLPFWLAITKRSSSAVGKILAGSLLLVMVYIIAKTGSRGALISFGVFYLVLVYHASIIGRAGLLLAAGLSLCAAVAFLPTTVMDRYKTLFSQDRLVAENASEERMLVSAESSTESREHLLRQSLILTATHPFFGVGVGQFSVAENDLAISQGRKKGSWLGTHNTYTQVASETGLMGLFFYASVLILSLKMTHSLYYSTRGLSELKEVSTHAESLFLSLLCLAITDLFIHVAYTMLLPVLAGMAISLEYTTRPLLAGLQRSKAVAAVVMPVTAGQVFPRPSKIRWHGLSNARARGL